jgi:hypothetical protein
MQRIATLICASLVLGMLASAQSVTYDYDKTADFSKVKTYAWVRGINVDFDGLTNKRIINAVDVQLASKGLTKVEPSENPDVLIAYYALFNKNLLVNWFASGWGEGFGGFGIDQFRSGSARAEEEWIGTVVVDMKHAKNKSVIWRGIARKEVDVKASPEKQDKTINKAAEKLFKNYPPRSSS